MKSATPLFESKLPKVATTIFTVMSQLAAECKAINLSQGYPDFDGPSELLDRVAWHIGQGHNQYAPMPGLPALRDQVAAKCARIYDIATDAETEITVVPGATEAIFCAIMATVSKGDEVIVFDPCYDCYAPAVELARGRTIHVPMRVPGFSIDWDAARAAVNANTRMIIINSPHNPTGSTLLADDLAQLADLVRDTGIIILSDEVYEHLVFDGRSHHSVLQHPELRARAFAVFSFGKTYHVTGWKTGYCIAPLLLTKELRKVHQFVTFVAVTPLQYALADFMAAYPGFPDTLADFYQEKRDLFCAGLKSSRFSYTPSAGTYFQLLEYSAVSDMNDYELARKLTKQHGVAAIPISVFCEEPGDTQYLRLCFAKHGDTLLEATRRLCKI